MTAPEVAWTVRGTSLKFIKCFFFPNCPGNLELNYLLLLPQTEVGRGYMSFKVTQSIGASGNKRMNLKSYLIQNVCPYFSVLWDISTLCEDGVL